MPSSLSPAAATPASPAAEAALRCYGAAAAAAPTPGTSTGWIMPGPLDASPSDPPPAPPAPAPTPFPVAAGFASEGASGETSGGLGEGARETARRLEGEAGVDVRAATLAEEATTPVAQGGAADSVNSPPVALDPQAPAGLVGTGPPRGQGGDHTRAEEHGIATGETTTVATATPAAAYDATPMSNLSDEAYTVVLVDVETTGLYPRTHRVIQLAAKVFGSQEPQHVFSAYVDPEGAVMPYFIQRLTGITPQILAANNARPFREIWPWFASWLTTVTSRGGGERGGARAGGVTGGGGGVIMVAHKASFDRNFLAHEVARAKLDSYTMTRIGVVSFVDSIAVLRRQSLWWQTGDAPDVPPRPKKSFALGALFKHAYGVEMPGAHTALGDVEGLERVLSAPGVRERWRSAASTDPACQIPVGCEFDEVRVRAENAPRPRPETTTTVVTPQIPDAAQRGGGGGAGGAGGAGEAGGAPGEEAATRLANSRMRAAEWARERNARKTQRR